MQWYFIVAIVVGFITLLFAFVGIKLARFTLRPTLISRQWQITRQIEEEKVDFSQFDNWNKKPFMLESNGATLIGQFVYNPVVTNKWVILSHGFTSSMVESYRYANVFYNYGYNCLMYDQRYFGHSSGKCSTMGYLESRDIVNIIDMLRKQEGEDLFIVVHGESMGAASALCALDLSNLIAAVVADCAFADLTKYYRAHLTEMTKINISFPVVDFANLYSLTYSKGFSFNKVSPINAVKRSNVPILFIHGREDTFIPRSNSITMFNACRNPLSRIYLADGAAHSFSFRVNNHEYSRILAEFLNSVYEERGLTDLLTVPPTDNVLTAESQHQPTQYSEVADLPNEQP